jgi:hypothetical protein
LFADNFSGNATGPLALAVTAPIFKHKSRQIPTHQKAKRLARDFTGAKQGGSGRVFMGWAANDCD